MKQNVIDDYNVISGQQKAAILMLSLDEERSASLFSLMDDEEIKELSVVMASLGKINSYYALKTFGVNAQPYYVLQGRGGKELVPPRGYDLDVQGFVDFLRSGVEAYDRQK